MNLRFEAANHQLGDLGRTGFNNCPVTDKRTTNQKSSVDYIGTSARKFQVLLPFEPFSHQLVFGEIVVYLMFSLSCFIDVSTYRFISSWSIYVLVSLFMQGFNCWLYIASWFFRSLIHSFLLYPLESLICFFNSPGTRRLTEFPEAAVGENPVFVDHLKKPPENCGFDNFWQKQNSMRWAEIYKNVAPLFQLFLLLYSMNPPSNL